MRRSAVMLALVVGMGALIDLRPSSAAESDQSAAARRAAGGILGAIDEVTVALNECAEVDPSNTQIYEGLGIRLAFDKDNASIAARALAVLREEGVRSGYGAESLVTLAGAAKEGVTALIKANQATDPAAFLRGCRAQPEAARLHTGYFAPLRARFPDAVRLLDEWR